MTYLSMQHIPLMRAYLCQDCNSIGNNSEFCPACASAALLGLSGVLNRDAGFSEMLLDNRLDDRRAARYGYPKPVVAIEPNVRTMVA
jgi:hypothetical protein